MTDRNDQNAFLNLSLLLSLVPASCLAPSNIEQCCSASRTHLQAVPATNTLDTTELTYAEHELECFIAHILQLHLN